MQKQGSSPSCLGSGGEAAVGEGLTLPSPLAWHRRPGARGGSGVSGLLSTQTCLWPTEALSPQTRCTGAASAFWRKRPQELRPPSPAGLAGPRCVRASRRASAWGPRAGEAVRVALCGRSGWPCQVPCQERPVWLPSLLNLGYLRKQPRSPLFLVASHAVGLRDPGAKRPVSPHQHR